MEPFHYHIYVCTQNKPDGVPCCARDGAEKVVEALKKGLADRFMTETTQLTTCGCLGLCEKGPNMVFYPEGIWYTGLTPEKIPEILDGHVGVGQLVHEMTLKDPAAARQEIIAHNRKVAGMKSVMEKAGVIPEELNRYLRGFMESRLVLSAIELDLFSAIGKGATARSVASTVKADARATEMMLNALVGIGLLAKEGGKYMNGSVTAEYLASGGKHDSRMATLHPAKLWHRWSTLTEAVKAGTAVAREDDGQKGDETRAFIAAMHKNSGFRAKMTVAQMDLEKVGHILDLGGGSGAYTIAFLQQKPDLKATLFDVPDVVELAKNYIAEAKLTDRVSFIQGDMSTDSLGKGYDLAWISAICHMWGENENADLIKRVYDALNPGGRIIIQDFILDADKTSPRLAAVFALNMLVNTVAGSTYSESEYRNWLETAGFKDIEMSPLPGPTNLMIGVK